MDDHEYNSSPDPIVLPSSPPSAHVRYRSNGSKIDRSKSPAKSFIINTPATRGKSPWRIRLTVEPQSDSELVDSSVHDRAMRNGTSQQRSPSHGRGSEAGRRATQRPSQSSTRKRKRAAPRDHINGPDTSMRPPASKSLRHLRPAQASVSPAEFQNIKPSSEVFEGAGEYTIANEDFTMISGDSLASIKANNSLLIARERAAKQVESNIDPDLENYTNSIVYPDLQQELTTNAVAAGDETVAKSVSGPPATTADTRTYDAMSWQPSSHFAASPQRRKTGALMESDPVAEPEVDATVADIWAEEASRSLEDDGQQPNEDDRAVVPPIFSDEPEPPRRAKIPSTWRKASGHDLSYSDSPAQPDQATHVNKNSMEVQPAFIPSPPRTDGNVVPTRRTYDANEDEHDLLEDSEITDPDGAATQLQGRDINRQKSAPLMATPRIRDQGATSPSADETGLFWRTHRKTLFSKGPQRPRLTQTTAPDLGGIFDAQTPQSNRESGTRHETTQQIPSERRSAREDLTRPARQQSSGSVPLRGTHVALPRIADALQVLRGEVDAVERESESQDRIAIQREQPKPRTYGRKYFGKQQQKHNLVEDSLESGQEVSHSYEEHLNQMSPGKLAIRFDDTQESAMVDSKLKPTKVYAPLFEAQHPEPVEEASSSEEAEELALDKARGTSSPEGPKHEPGLFNKLASAFWSAVIRPTGPIYLEPAPVAAFEDEPEFSSALRAKLRGRYGVLQERHPWTMVHMRTLHRMVKSVTTRGHESMVPTSLDLPQYLEDIIDTFQLSVTSDDFLFSFEHACAVWAFMQILVPVSLVRAMERGEVEWLGDGITESYRGRLGGRRGSELCFKTVSTPEGAIDWQWLVACVGNVEFAEQFAEQAALDDKD